jgi:hypothetical protein
MRKLLTFLAIPAMFSAVALADSWSGGLLDASCYERQNQQLKDMAKAAEACGATSQTNAFALHASGKVFKFDSTGNTKAMGALKNRADRSAPGAAPQTSITAKVEGTESGGTIKVESIEVQ